MRGRVYHLFSYFTEPKTKDKDQARREFILNTLLLGLIILSTVAVIWTLVGELNEGIGKGLEGTSILVICIWGFFLCSYFIARRYSSRIIAFLLVGLLLASTLYTSSIWGIDLPEGLLTYSLIITMSGILINSRFSLIITSIIISFISIFMYAHINHYMNLSTSWHLKPATYGDTVVFSITLSVIALISWLFNHEMEAALKRAQQSEKELKHQRDNLEILVRERTKDLQQAQLEKLTQLYHFAEFGRSASGLFHDLMTPLNLVSLNLENLELQNKEINPRMSNIQKYVNRAIYGTKKLESFINIARKQLKDNEEDQKFSVSHEVEQIIKLVSYRAKQSQIKVYLSPKKNLFTVGKVVKFDQMVLNLINNALDALELHSENQEKYINISIAFKKGLITIEIEDNGPGISQKDLSKIFEPSFSTKKSKEHMGLGLYISKSIVKKDFGGEIYVDAIEKLSTTFYLRFPQRIS